MFETKIYRKGVLRVSIPVIFILYFISAAVLVFFSIKCAEYVDLLDKKTSISGAFIGGVILAAVTSLPELVTSLSAIYIAKESGLIIGNVLGSNIFNLCIFGGSVILAAKAFSKSKIGKAHIATLICTLVACALMAVVFWVNTGNDTAFGQIPVLEINVMSLLILVVYFISFRFLSGDDSDNDEEDTSSLTVKQIIIRFVLMALGLVAMSIIVTLLTDELKEALHLDASLAGALFLGVATSLPELSSSVALVRRRNFNAMIGNVVGSNMFNFTIFSIADLVAFSAIYPSAASVSFETKCMLIFGVLSTLLMTGAILLQGRMKEKTDSKTLLVVYVSVGILMIASYLVSIVLPTVLV